MLIAPRRVRRRAVIVVVVLVLVALVTGFFPCELADFDLPDLDHTLFDLPVSIAPEDPAADWSNHPVMLLHAQAQAKFEALIKRQSKSPQEAEDEYVRRYGRNPPPGFRQWVQYALVYKSPIIDDFDTLSDSVHRFHHLTAAEIARRVREAGQGKIVNFHGAHHDRIGRCVFANQKFSKGCRHFADPLTEMLGDARKLAPNVEFLLNFLDEPSVLGSSPPQGGKRPSASWTDLSQQPIASRVAEACRIRGNSTTKIAIADIPIHTYGLPFVQDVEGSKDLCQHPELASSHGFLMGPTTFRQMRTELPLLSQAAPHPFSDILYPSTHYGLKTSLYKQIKDRSWSRKKNAVYWAGSSTGGVWTPTTWRHGHRQRLATLGLQHNNNAFTYLHTSPNIPFLTTINTTNPLPPSLFAITLTKIVNSATPAVHAAQESFFHPPHSPDPDNRALRYRLALDIDGNSYSGRFYRLLASRSAPLKMTVFREWHDDRLVPWLHYFPVSAGMEELPELVRFLTSTDEGRRIAEGVARAGRAWYHRALGEREQGVYLYRVMVEMAWLRDGGRKAVTVPGVAG
ncbi:hypothetical protein B0T19DRAFT_471411 [Cercophora scortea]|uniref:Glycosyl transferase CAP10 domain-containing protein n=1 Tax=Cercophora scortea TaxID=314031 RepID=A0AAE0MKU0_9PEZI|nr:hypothetical protein B0T19DRAFT_471411 [Cercophora scortea]